MATFAPSFHAGEETFSPRFQIDSPEFKANFTAYIYGGGNWSGEIYIVDAEESESDIEALAKIAIYPKRGDIGIARRMIAAGKQIRTAYIYTTQWESMDGGEFPYQFGDTFKVTGNMLDVNIATQVEKDNTLPITAAAVYQTVGNIEILLGTI